MTPVLKNLNRARRNARLSLLMLPLGFALQANGAEALRPGEPTNVVNIAASGFLDAPQDWLTLTLTTAREGSDATVVQTQLKQALDAALTVARSAAAPRQLEARTGQVGLYPRYGSNGKINGWQGSAELILEGRDFVRISSTAGKIPSLTLSSMVFSLSREAQQKLESDVQAMAIERFKAKAAEVTKGFGFSGYSLRELAVSAVDQGPSEQPRPVLMQAKASSMSADAPVPAEAGKSQISVTVSGSIQLR